MNKPLFFFLTGLFLSVACIAQTEVFSNRQIQSGLNAAWEVVYGPNDSLWITENKAYTVSRISLGTTPVKTQLLDLSSVKDFPTNSGPQPQGGLMGLAIHPNLYSSDPAVRAAKPWVYIAYVYHRISTSCPNDATATSCNFNTRIVRYNYSGNTLSSPTIILDGLPGSSDHNSGRLVISPSIEPGADAAHTQYRLYYTIGDMGAGQLTNLTRTENALNADVTEGKVLRLNTEADGDGGADNWVPDDNPFYNNSDGISGKDYVYSMGHRNPQGLAWGNVSGVDRLYSSEQMDRADDEINIIQKGHNYGWDHTSGNGSDGDVNGFKIGQTTVSNEANNALAITNYTDPIFTFFHHNTTYPSNYPPAGSTNGPWPTVALSSIDFYSQTLIPGWKNSLLVTPLKESRIYRTKLNTAGDGISGDTISYLNGAGNRVRRVRISSSNGRKFYVARDAGTITEYTFLGYPKDASNKSTIPSIVPVTTTTTTNTVISGSTITIDATNNNYWVPITGPDGNILAEIFPNGNNLGTVTSTFYIRSGGIRQDATGRRYLNRSFTITPANQPTLPAGNPLVRIRLYLTQAEFDALDANSLSGVDNISDLLIRKNNDASPAALTNTTTDIVPTFAEAYGSSGAYVLQANISSFSSFYIGSSAPGVLPVALLNFDAVLENNIALLKWKTASETNTAQFVVERSTDMYNFQSIGEVAAGGNSTSVINYKFTDYDVMKQSSSVVYYRLKMTDIDGAYKYSDAVKITLPFISGRVNLFPNPANEEVNVVINAATDGKAQWKLLDNTGRVIMQSKELLRKGSNSFSISISKLSSGVYYFVISGAGVDQQVKLQKL